MTTLMRFTAFLFRHPVIMVCYWIIMASLEYYLLVWAIQSFTPDWWTPTFEMWFGLIWLLLCAISFLYVVYVRARYGRQLQHLFGNLAIR